MTPSALAVKDLTCEYQRWGQKVLALDHVSLEIPKGQWLVIAGHNGAGKSTLLRLVSGKVSTYLGEVKIGEAALRDLSDRDRSQQVFYVHQEPSLGSAPMLTVYENLLIADPHSRRVSRAALQSRYRMLLAEAGLDNRLHHPAHYLSGGERQLLAFLIARLRPVSLVLLDEALAAMDPSRVAVCLRLITELQREGKTLIFVTHSMELASTVGDRTVVLSKGSIVYDCTGHERHPEQIRAMVAGLTRYPAEVAL